MDGKIIQEQMQKLSEDLRRYVEQDKASAKETGNEDMARWFDGRAQGYEGAAQWILDRLQACGTLDVHRQLEEALREKRGVGIAEDSNCAHCGSLVGTINPSVMQCMECGEKVNLEGQDCTHRDGHRRTSDNKLECVDCGAIVGTAS